MESQMIPITKTILSRKNKTGDFDIIVPDFKLYYKIIMTKTASNRPENRPIGQWNKLAHTYNHATFVNWRNKHLIEKGQSI